MIIQILSNLKEEGYIAKSYHPTVAPFFAGANVAFRRNALKEIGGFDTRCQTGEDCDLCARLSAMNWELYMRRGAKVWHKNPSTLRHLIRQWYGYGRYHPYVFAKHNDRAIEVHRRMRQPINGERYACLLYRPFPIAIVVFVTQFLLFHLFCLGVIAMWMLGWSTGGWMGIALTSIIALLYAWPDLKRSGFLIGWVFSAIRYVADMALFVGAFVGGLHQRMLYLSATVD
jgi:GT2 family glycosyltransferase